jgi:lipopolysaccharide transport system ATP-binding protein
MADAKTKQSLLTLNNVSKRFFLEQEQQDSFQEMFVHLFRRKSRRKGKEFWALRNVSFDVNAGESLGILGPNGSGKSTLLKLITGILEPTEGEIVVNGRLSALLELGSGFHPDLTGRENILLNGSLYGLSRREMQRQMQSIIDFAELGEFIDMPVKHYSSGMYVRLGFAVAIHTSPDLLLVDEVLAVGDATFQHKCMDAIQEFRRQGGTLLLVSHDLGAIESICDRAIWYEHGKVQRIGHPTEVVMGYLNHVAAREEAARTAAGHARSAAQLDQSQRWGTGRVQIVNVRLCDQVGASRSIFLTNSPMHIHLHYYAEERVADPIFGIAIHHQNGTWVSGPNTDFGDLPIPYVEGEGEIVFRIPQLPLLAGGYTVSVAAVNRADTEMYDYHDRAYPFRVHTGNTRERFGLVTFNGTWGLQEHQPLLPLRSLPAEVVHTQL